MPIITTLLLSSVLYAQTGEIRPVGDVCQWGASAVRIYTQANGVISGDRCVPDDYVDGNVTVPSAPPSPQNAYVIQHLENTLRSSGFRTKLTPYTGKNSAIAVISATREQRNVISQQTDPRFYTMLDGDEILITVSGTQLTFYYSVDGTIDPTKTTTVNFAPSDISHQILELDTRISYNQPSDQEANLINVTVCTRRGSGVCHVFTPSIAFGNQSPEFSLGSTMTGYSELRARYCRLPQFGNVTFPSSGYTPSCPGPVAP